MNNFGIKLNFDMSDTHLIRGDVKSITEYDTDKYISRVDFILPYNIDDLKCGRYEVIFNDKIIGIEIILIKDKNNDPLLNFGRHMSFGSSNQSGLPNSLPFEVFTDNRGIYPVLLASIFFPYMLAQWIDETNPLGFKIEYDPELLQVAGSQKNNEKIISLIMFNKLIDKLKLPNVRKLKYEDITVFSELYFLEDDPNPKIIKLNALSSKDAYRNAVEDYYFNSIEKNNLKESINNIKTYAENIVIENESDLFSIVSKSIDDVLIHNIENRRWIEPFWDGERKVKINGKDHLIPQKPKNEIDIQPTLHIILDMALNPLGIHVIRESNEGIGFLDFKFLYTTIDKNAISIGAEFKLAHHKRIKHGITNQLPSYLVSIRSLHGLFIVMWFKDNKYFNEPNNRNIDQMKEWLISESNNIKDSTDFVIESKVINASIKTSASKV